MTATIPVRPSVSAGGWIAVSGQLGVRDGGLVEGVAAQAAQALANLKSVVEAGGARLSDVVKTNVFLVTMDDYAVMNAEYAKVFGGDAPARTAVAVAALPFGARIEIEAWVYRPAAR
jgi:2-iminobutanoate/2-iminopropanoate deaminase